jgi:hypothetical protein
MGPRRNAPVHLRVLDGADFPPPLAAAHLLARPRFGVVDHGLHRHRRIAHRVGFVDIRLVQVQAILRKQLRVTRGLGATG